MEGFSLCCVNDCSIADPHPLLNSVSVHPAGFVPGSPIPQLPAYRSCTKFVVTQIRLISLFFFPFFISLPLKEHRKALPLNLSSFSSWVFSFCSPLLWIPHYTVIHPLSQERSHCYPEYLFTDVQSNLVRWLYFNNLS